MRVWKLHPPLLEAQFIYLNFMYIHTLMYISLLLFLKELGLQPEDNFVLKVVQLEELIHVRHSIFVIGNAGTGKSKILRSLNKTYHNMKRKPVWQDLNPKAVTNDELFGYINPATREWKDGTYVLIWESGFGTCIYIGILVIYVYMYVHINVCVRENPIFACLNSIQLVR